MSLRDSEERQRRLVAGELPEPQISAEVFGGPFRFTDDQHDVMFTNYGPSLFLRAMEQSMYQRKFEVPKP